MAREGVFCLRQGKDSSLTGSGVPAWRLAEPCCAMPAGKGGSDATRGVGGNRRILPLASDALEWAGKGAFEQQQKTGRDREGGWKPCQHVALKLEESPEGVVGRNAGADAPGRRPEALQPRAVPSAGSTTEWGYAAARPAFFQTSFQAAFVCAAVGDVALTQASKDFMVPPKTREWRPESQPSTTTFCFASTFFAMVMVEPERLDVMSLAFRSLKTKASVPAVFVIRSPLLLAVDGAVTAVAVPEGVVAGTVGEDVAVGRGAHVPSAYGRLEHLPGFQGEDEADLVLRGRQAVRDAVLREAGTVELHCAEHVLPLLHGPGRVPGLHKVLRKFVGAHGLGRGHGHAEGTCLLRVLRGHGEHQRAALRLHFPMSKTTFVAALSFSEPIVVPGPVHDRPALEASK